MNKEFRPPLCPRCQTELVKHKDKNYWVCPNWKPQNKGCEGAIWYQPELKKANYPNIAFSYKIESKSNKGYWHQVKFYESGDIYCDCVAYQMGKFCSHQKKAIEEIEKIIKQIKDKNYPKAE